MRQLSVFLPLVLLGLIASGQQKLTIEDLFSRKDLNPKGIRGLQWIKGSDKYSMPDQQSGEYLLIYDLKKEKPDTIIKSKELSSDLTKIPDLNWLDANGFYFMHSNKLHRFDMKMRKTDLISETDKNAENIDIDPNKLSVAYTLENNLFVNKRGNILQITREDNKDIVCGRSVHREEFGISKGTFWSPSGNAIAFYRMDQSMVSDYPIMELGTLPAKNKAIKYPMAGQKSHHVTLGIYNLASNGTTYIQTGLPADQYLTNIAWSPDEKHILIALVNRDQNEMRLNVYSSLSGEYEKTLFVEKDAEWVEPMHPPSFLKGNTNLFIWQSERSGTNQLYLYNIEGKLIQQITKGDFTVTRYLGADDGGKYFYAEVSINNGLEKKLIRTDLKGNVKIITQQNGSHSIQLADSRKYFIDTHSSLNIPLNIFVCNMAGSVQRNLHTFLDPTINYVLPKPELIQLKSGDGIPLNGRIFKPANMDTTRKYPVLVYVYGGPHVQLISDRWMGGASLWLSWMASQGYVVFSLDNRGSADRGQFFEQGIHRKLGTLEMEDQLAGIAHLKSLKYVDASRIGIHGWSFGGFMTTTLMCKNPGVFKAGVCGGPVIDWKMYEVMYTERYMDTPEENKEGYESSNLLNHAANLKDRLLMIHGTADDVVLWQHGQEFVKKCVDNGSLIDYMLYPGHGHNVTGKDRLHLMKTITRYFQDNL